MSNSRTTIGKIERIDLPTLDVFNVPAKIDTGTYRSALHCNIIESIQEDDTTFLKILLTDLTDQPIANHISVVEQIDTRNIRSSNGSLQERPVIELQVGIRDSLYKTEFTLTNRSDMRYPILIGRYLLRKRFVVDVAKGRHKRKE